jgi:hypothetical protein
LATALIIYISRNGKILERVESWDPRGEENGNAATAGKTGKGDTSVSIGLCIDFIINGVL